MSWLGDEWNKAKGWASQTWNDNKKELPLELGAAAAIAAPWAIPELGAGLASLGGTAASALGFGAPEIAGEAGVLAGADFGGAAGGLADVGGTDALGGVSALGNPSYLGGTTIDPAGGWGATVTPEPAAAPAAFSGADPATGSQLLGGGDLGGGTGAEPALGSSGGAGGTTASTTGGNIFKSLAGGIKDYAPLAGAGVLGYELLRGEPKIPPQAQQVSAADQGILNTGNQFLQMGIAGQITPAQQQQIEQYVQQQKNQLYQSLAASGQDPTTSSAYQQGLIQIQNNAISMWQQFTQQLITEGLQASGQASSALLTAAQIQQQQDANYQTAIANAAKAFGLTLGIRST